MVLGAVLFVAVWVVATLALGRLAWFRRRPVLAERLEPYVDGGDPIQEIEDWLRQRAESRPRRGVRVMPPPWWDSLRGRPFRLHGVPSSALTR